MKKYILFLSAVSALAVTSCRKIEVDGEKEIIYVNQAGGGTTGQIINLSGRITTDILLEKKNTYILKDRVYVTNGATMKIEAGTVIKGSFTGPDVAALIIARGAKINAQGTATEPIIFTSSSPNPQSGDWGGIVICGKAGINTTTNGVAGLFSVEGGIDNVQGDGLAGSGDAGNALNDADSSGVFSYVRIEYAGYASQPDKEINSLTLACVGSKTVIDHVQTYYAKDDAFEWFGGTVNCKYLVAVKTQDDDFDTDNGYRGNVQFGLIIRDSVIADISTSEAFESDNNSSGTAATPKTAAVFSNITAIGPRATLGNVGNPLFRAAVQIRRNSSISIYNSILIGWSQAILIDASTGSPTDNNILDNSLRIKNTTLAGNTINVKYAASGAAPTGATDATILAWFTDPINNNNILTNTTDAKLIQPFNYAAVDPTPFAGGNGNALINTGASFTDSKVAIPFFTSVTFRGGIAPAGVEGSWWKGWTRF
jgi:hypothetical protein